ncbi:MAG TPA: hypothetical protein VFG46_10595 [Chryseolinea sp.]|nr:hypothetical protein [Chryseolinea sp.]
MDCIHEHALKEHSTVCMQATFGAIFRKNRMANIEDQYHRETSSKNPADLQPVPDNSENLFARTEKYSF